MSLQKNQVSGGPNIKEMRRKQREQIQIAKDLFLLWDSDGEGSLSVDELIKAFMKIGLSQDHRFAKKIINAIKPPTQEDVPEQEIEIKLRDFISVFKNDEISDKILKKINEEIRDRKFEDAEEAFFQRQREAQETIQKNARFVSS